MIARVIVVLWLSFFSFAWNTEGWAQSPSSADGSSANQSAAPGTGESMNPPMVGDHWTYEVRDEITGELKGTETAIITDLTPAEIAVRVQSPTSLGPAVFIFDESWNLKTSPAWRFSPNDGTGIKKPLAVGNAWKFQNDQIRSVYGITFKNIGASKVVGTESITTAAGTFDALRIETSTKGHNANDPTKTFESKLTTYYVPTVDHWVKRTTTWSFNGRVNQNQSVELVEYGRR